MDWSSLDIVDLEKSSSLKSNYVSKEQIMKLLSLNYVFVTKLSDVFDWFEVFQEQNSWNLIYFRYWKRIPGIYSMAWQLGNFLVMDPLGDEERTVFINRYWANSIPYEKFEVIDVNHLLVYNWVQWYILDDMFNIKIVKDKKWLLQPLWPFSNDTFIYAVHSDFRWATLHGEIVNWSKISMEVRF